MRSDDLVPFLNAPPQSKAVGARQGIIIFWNPVTAENQVLVGTSLMTNLTILNTSEAALLAEGDVVTLLTMGSSWGILGRMTIPGTPEAVTGIKAITNRIQAAEDASSGSRSATTYGDLSGVGVGPEVTVTVGPSGRVLCFWSAEIGQTTSGGFIAYQTRNTPHVSVAVSGASTVAANDWNALNFNLEHPGPGFAGEALTSFWGQAAMMHLFTGLNEGDTTFTMKYRTDTLVPANTANFSAREIAVFVL